MIFWARPARAIHSRSCLPWLPSGSGTPSLNGPGGTGCSACIRLALLSSGARALLRFPIPMSSAFQLPSNAPQEAGSPLSAVFLRPELRQRYTSYRFAPSRGPPPGRPNAQGQRPGKCITLSECRDARPRVSTWFTIIMVKTKRHIWHLYVIKKTCLSPTWKVFKHLPGFFPPIPIPSNETWKVSKTFQVFPPPLPHESFCVAIFP